MATPEQVNSIFTHSEVVLLQAAVLGWYQDDDHPLYDHFPEQAKKAVDDLLVALGMPKRWNHD